MTEKVVCVTISSVLCFRQVAHRISFLSRQRDVIASFWFFVISRKLRNFCGNTVHFDYFIYIYGLQSLFRHIIVSPVQKRGGCGHLMAAFDNHSFCARFTPWTAPPMGQTGVIKIADFVFLPYISFII